MSIFQDRGQAGQQILDGWVHAIHANHVDNAFQGAKDGP